MKVMTDEEMDEDYNYIVEQIDQITFQYAHKDPEAVGGLLSSIARTCTSSFKKTITFAELFDGVELHLFPEETYKIDLNNNESEDDIGISPDDFNSKVIADFLNYISLQTFKEGRFLASVVVVYARTYGHKKKGTPGWGFYELATQIGLLAEDAKDEDREGFRKSQADKASAYYEKRAKERREEQEEARAKTKRIPPQEIF